MRDVANALRRLGRELRGCRGTFTMDYDGLPLEVVRPVAAGPDLDAIGAEMAAVIREARQAALDLGLGVLKGVTVRAGGPTMIFQACGRDYLLAAVLDRASSAVVARRALAEAVRHGLGAV
jgi:predicted regulator of Ras-like GTPase activity (Roadblock/LC7/MglB family)